MTLQGNVKITGNTATNDDGNQGPGGEVTTQNDTEIIGCGGGIYVEEDGTVTIPEDANVEITGNKAGKNGLGGGVYNAGAFTMHSGAIYGNSAKNAAADFYNAESGTFTLVQAGTPGTWMNRVSGIRASLMKPPSRETP